ncbi:MAG: hypothetical protein WDN28_01630 [Chthoniobacter sp.]
MKTITRSLLIALFAMAINACAGQAPRRTASGKVLKLETITRATGPNVYVFREVNPSDPQGPRVLQ